jgi:hypothetical protein
MNLVPENMLNIQNRYAYLKYRFRMFASRHWWLLNVVYGRLKKHRNLLIQNDTALVIEGYPRSANTFASRAFQGSNPDARIAHHMHAQAQIIEAVRRGLPALVLIRHPDEAIKSMLVRHPHVGLRAAVLSYVQFYEDLEPLLDGYLLADFKQVTADFASIIDQVNKRFGCQFTRFEHSDSNVDKIFTDMDKDNRAFYGEYKVSHVPRPLAERDKIKAYVNLDSEADLIARARGVYQRLSGQVIS